MHFNLPYLHKEVWDKMAYMRKQYKAAFKGRVALEAVKGEKTIAQIASETGVHPTLGINEREF